MPFFCLNTSTIRPQPLIDKIRIAAEAGYDGIELWINDVYEYIGRGGNVADVERALAETRLRLPCMIAVRNWGDAVGPEFILALEEARRRMELAARLGSPLVVCTPPRESCPLPQLVERYHELLRIGKDVGVRATFEYVSSFKSARSLAQAWQVVQATEDADATLILDSFHNFNSCSTLDDLRAIPVERISHYHLSDGSREKPPGRQLDADRVMPGEGAARLCDEIRLLRAKGYEGGVSLELFNLELWEEPPLEVAREGLRRLKQMWSPAD